LIPDTHEPLRVSDSVSRLGLDYTVITSVTRDDLEDGGASVFVQTIEKIKKACPGIKIEVLLPDFSGKKDCLERVLDASPCVVAHNIETVKRLYRSLRPDSDYLVCLGLLNAVKKARPLLTTKSSLMLGLGETKDDLVRAMQDLVDAGCDILVLGQYLAPSGKHYPVKEYVSPDKFKMYGDLALELGFKAVLSEPLARSSYRAAEMYKQSLLARELMSS